MDMGFMVPLPIDDDVFSATPAAQAGKWKYIPLYILGNALSKRI
jgi:hypothetical protein